MSNRERLHEIIDRLSPYQVDALVALFEPALLSDEEFLRKINSPPPLDIDEETAAELRAALAEREETISHEQMKRELGLA